MTSTVRCKRLRVRRSRGRPDRRQGATGGAGAAPAPARLREPVASDARARSDNDTNDSRDHSLYTNTWQSLTLLCDRIQRKTHI